MDKKLLKIKKIKLDINKHSTLCQKGILCLFKDIACYIKILHAILRYCMLYKDITCYIKILHVI